MTDDKENLWIEGRRDAEAGRPMNRSEIDYVDGWTSRRRWTETWDEYLERREPIIALRDQANKGEE